MTTEYQITQRKEELKGRWCADYNRSSDDFKIENNDSRELFEMIQILAQKVDELESREKL